MILKVEITVKGIVNPVTGMVINITILKKFIQVFNHKFLNFTKKLKIFFLKDILDQLDHKNLDVDVEYFKNVVR